ncbi:MAG: hypothetical protein M1820_007458 [Bogoriella megaspora]|nr:MAG: hypothetical protein M1820_007458 [Bogoriella megaspora]
MKFINLLPLAASITAFVIPDEQVLADVAIESKHQAKEFYDKLPTQSEILDGIRKSVDDVSEATKNAFDEAVDFATKAGSSAYDSIYEAGFDAEAWLNTAKSCSMNELDDFEGPLPSTQHNDRPQYSPDGHHHGPHHGHKKPNQTVYQLIAESKYTTKLAKLINDDEDLVKLLNGTSANFTIFAPTDRAFEKIPDHAPKPSPEQIKALLSYHVSPEFYPAGRVLKTHTIPTLLSSDNLGYKSLPQRLAINAGLKGLTVNFYSRIVAIDIFGTNGVIHGVDSLIIPPPRVIKIIDLVPGEFSTLELGLGKTGLLDKLNTTDHPGGTLFAPSNFAFQKLGPRINAFLFSQHGLKYLEALLKYHVVGDGNTLYSDAYYKTSKDESDDTVDSEYLHLDLPTLLEDGDKHRTVAVDIARYGPFISFKVNAFSRVVVQDGVAKDGVIQVVGNVLIPPKRVQGKDDSEWTYDRELTVEELRERLAPYVSENEAERWDL